MRGGLDAIDRQIDTEIMHFWERLQSDEARAFAIEPNVLLMDKSFSALDELTARRLRQHLLKIPGTFRATVIFVTHNAFEASFLSDRILMMTKGPGCKFCNEIDLQGLARPRSYEDVRIFEKSRQVVERLVSRVGSIDDV